MVLRRRRDVGTRVVSAFTGGWRWRWWVQRCAVRSEVVQGFLIFYGGVKKVVQERQISWGVWLLVLLYYRCWWVWRQKTVLWGFHEWNVLELQWEFFFFLSWWWGGGAAQRGVTFWSELGIARGGLSVGGWSSLSTRVLGAEPLRVLEANECVLEDCWQS